MTPIRNVAIIAHVDHGKTTLVDKLLHAGNLFHEREKPAELMLDNNDLERERGITILSKNVSIRYKDHKINLIDTPGHSDFGGEVERVLNMADGVLLLVDAFEGPMPQTRFVLSKSLELGLKPIVVVNKVDKPNCKPDEAYEAVFDLMFALEATEEQLDFPVVYGSAKNGWMGPDWATETEDVTYALDMIIEHVPPPKVELEGDIQMMITSLAYSNFTGRMASGRLNRGVLKPNMPIGLVSREGVLTKQRTKKIFVYEGLGRVEVDEVQPGDICAISGIDGFEIGDTVTHPERPDPLTPIAVDEPTMSMTFAINDSPFFGQSGKFVTSRHLKERLEKEIEQNLALKVMPTDRAEAFQVFGRGVLHLSVLIETMRREGYEVQIGQPQVIVKEVDGKRHEPMEDLYINVPDEYSGAVINAVTQRKGTMTNMEAKPERTFLEFSIPSRGIIGLRTQLITQTAGELIMTHRFREFAPWVGDIPKRINGSMISNEKGKAIPYSLNSLQERGILMVLPNEEIYEGQVVGENARPGDMVVNLTKAKKQSNVRSSGADDKIKITPPRQFTLEEALEYIQGDEYVEVTPDAMRIRKIVLSESERKRNRNPALAGMKI
jgi:GTP-binding protein